VQDYDHGPEGAPPHAAASAATGSTQSKHGQK
jgi:hypothetical protein